MSNNQGKCSDTAIVKLDGTKIMEDGTITKTNLFNFLEVDLDDYSDIQMTEEEAQRFMNHVKRMKTGVSAFMPKLCPGPNKCKMGDRCPFKERFPIARACPLEVNLVRMKTREYIEELDIDPDSPYDMALINSLVELDVMDYRVNICLSREEGEMLIKNKTYSESEATGDLIVTSENVTYNPLIDIKEKIHRKRAHILEMFTVTRREEYKKIAALKNKTDDDASNHMASIKEMLMNKLNSNHASVKEDVVEADWEMDE